METKKLLNSFKHYFSKLSVSNVIFSACHYSDHILSFSQRKFLLENVGHNVKNSLFRDGLSAISIKELKNCLDFLLDVFTSKTLLHFSEELLPFD